MAAIILCLSASVLLLCGSGVYGDPVADSEVSFSVPFIGTYGRDRTRCLADVFKPGLMTVLLGNSVTCEARTADTFIYPEDKQLKATRLKGTEKCLAEMDTKRFRVAVVGVDPSAVRVVEPTTDESPLSKEIESKARKIASSAYQRNFRNPEGSVIDVADSPPKVFSVGNTAFLLFKCTDGFYNQDGLPVLVLNSNAFLLKGKCARSPFFFSVKEKLYVSYWATVACCGCGDSNFFVYDLLGASPKLVYQNSDFSD
jgi:hypothetical protein